MNSSLRIGLDIVETKRFKDIESKTRFMENVFTKEERDTCLTKLNPSESLAARFAAKESVRKTIKENLKYNNIQITNDKNGAPVVTLLDESAKNHYHFQISVSHTEAYAAAVCLTIIL